MFRTIATLAVAAGIAASPAFAASDDFELAIEFDRANFATPAGAAVEYERISDEVKDQCKEDVVYKGVRRVINIAQCEKETMQKVVIAINDANLTAVHTAAYN